MRRRRERQDLEFRVVPGVNGLLRAVLGLERAFLRVASLPFGSSIIAIATRPGHLSGRDEPPMIAEGDGERRPAR